MKKQYQLKYICNQIENCEKRLQNVENNLQYIKVLKSFLFWFGRLSMFQNSKEYKKYFCGFPFSIFDRVQNSILAYQYGEKPF